MVEVVTAQGQPRTATDDHVLHAIKSEQVPTVL
jgi:hypothetical protein